MFIIEDELHAEQQAEFETYGAAIVELKRRAAISWDQPPNQAPCQSWRTCGRQYVVIEWDEARLPAQVSRTTVLAISAEGVKWHVAA